MQLATMTVALTMYWLAGVVGAASLLPDDQYAPQQSPYSQDAARGPRGYPNWLDYRRDPNAELSEPPEDKPGLTSTAVSDSSGERKTRKDLVIQDWKFPPRAPSGWDVVTAGPMRNFTAPPRPDTDVPEKRLEISSVSREDPYESDDGFEDQGPGSVEVYKLDLRRENSLLVSQAKRKLPAVSSGIKSKIPKKATADEILWKVKPVEPVKTLLPAIFRQPTIIHRGEAIPPESMDRIEEKRKDEVSSVGGVPELQIGCEGLEASDRKRRFSGPGDGDDDEEWWPKFKDPVYRESTEPILLRVTPIVLDFEDEPPSGQIYEELDELLKLKSTTTPEPTTKRANRGDIDPALENYQHGRTTTDEKLPERGDLGPNGSKDGNGGEASMPRVSSRESKLEGMRFPRRANGEDALSNNRVGNMNPKISSPIIGSPSESVNHRGGRKLLRVQHPESSESQPKTRHDRAVNDQQRQALWGFGEDDGEIPGDDDEPDADNVRKLEEEKRRREYERRRQEDVERRRSGHRHHAQEHPSRIDDGRSENERMRQEYERRREREERERRRFEEERRKLEVRRQWEEHRRRMEEVKRRQSEESRRGVKDEEGRNRDPSQSRRMEDEKRLRDYNRSRQEEERRIRLEDERTDQAPPSQLIRPSPYHRQDNRSRSLQDEERRRIDEQRLREYTVTKRPIEVGTSYDRRRPDDQTGRRNNDEERRKYVEALRRRQMEEHRRRQRTRDEEERRRQMDELRRRDRTDEDHAREDEARKRLEEERKLRDYVRRNQPIHVPRRNSSRERETNDWQEQRRTIDEARRWEHNRQQIPRTNDGRSHGPSAPTNIGQRQLQEDPEGLRRRQERERLERMRFQEEGRRREEEYRRAESRRHEQERQRLEMARRMEESNRRRPSWEDSRRPANASRGSNETRDREPGELRRPETIRRISDSPRRNQDDESRRRSEERERQRQRAQHEERERMRMEHAADARNNARRRPQHEDTRPNEARQRGVGVETQNEAERRMREEARLRALPVSARIVIRSDESHSRNGGTSDTATLVPPTFEVGSRGGFGNEIDFPALNPHRPGLAAARFPAPGTEKPPRKSPSECVWAIVNCCPANDRLGTCFESMGCWGVNWDPNPCRADVQAAARAQVLSFYETAETH